jgi:hypothetical protein
VPLPAAVLLSVPLWKGHLLMSPEFVSIVFDLGYKFQLRFKINQIDYLYIQ